MSQKVLFNRNGIFHNVHFHIFSLREKVLWTYFWIKLSKLCHIFFMQTAVGILGTEAYHAGAIRTKLKEVSRMTVFPFGVKLGKIVNAISTLRSKVGGGKDAGIRGLVPADSNAVVYARTTREVLNIVYLGGSTKGGYFPRGMNGAITK